MDKKIILVPVVNINVHPELIPFVNSEKESEDLKLSFEKSKMHQPIIIQSTDLVGMFYVISGVSRLEATKAAGKKEINAIVEDQADPFDVYIQTNLNVNHRTPIEKAEMIASALSRDKKKTAKEFGEEHGMSESSVSHYRAIAEKIDKGVLEKLKEIKPDMGSPCLRKMTRLDPNEQEKFVNDLAKGKVEPTEEGVQAFVNKSIEKKEKAVQPKENQTRDGMAEFENLYDRLHVLFHEHGDLSATDLKHLRAEHEEFDDIYNKRIKDQESKEIEKENNDETK